MKVKLNEFFGFHFAVLGIQVPANQILLRILFNVFFQKDYSARGAKFIVFDSNGEYEAAFKSVNEINSQINARFLSTSYDAENRLTIPVWALSVDDWAILLHASEKTQVPIISRALDMIKVFDSPGR